jgi:hypothetical protein
LQNIKNKVQDFEKACFKASEVLNGSVDLGFSIHIEVQISAQECAVELIKILAALSRFGKFELLEVRTRNFCFELKNIFV